MSTMQVNGFAIVRTPSAVRVEDSRGGLRYEIDRAPGAVARCARFARMQRGG